jgi:hypothetical protein
MQFNDLFSSPPRETAGPNISTKFDYQKDWSLCKLIELELSGKDYLILFDFHEDLLICDSENSPCKADFFQLKCEDRSNWTISSLTTKNKKSKIKGSILGKLYLNKIRFADFVNSLNFVSNAPMEVKVSDGSNAKTFIRFSLNNLTNKDKDNLIKKLSNELKINKDKISTDIIFFEKTDLSPEDSSNHTKGKLLTFLETNYSHLVKYCPSIYDSLFRDIKIKSGYKKRINPSEWKLKGISKSDFQSKLNNISPGPNNKETKDKIIDRLNTEGVSITKITSISQQIDSYFIVSQDKTNLVLFSLKESILKIIGNIDRENIINTMDLLVKVKAEYNAVKKEEEETYQNKLLDGLILYEYYAKYFGEI